MSNYRIEDRLKAMGYDPSTLEENDKIAIATNLNYLHDEYIEEIAENPWYVPGGVVNVYDDNYVPVTSIIINGEIPKLNVGDTYTINATVKPDNASFKQLLYNSGDASIVTIDKKGKITSKAIGTTTITVISDDNEAITAEATVEVKIGVTSVTVSGAELVKTGTPQQLSVTVEPEDATYKEVTWESSDENVATVDDTGLVTAIAGGNVTITATSTDNPNAIGSHNMIAEISVTGVTVSGPELVKTGTPQQLSVTVTPNDATHKEVTWTSSDTNVATVSSTGLVTAISEGNVTITATSVDNPSAIGSHNMTVEVSVTGVTVNGPELVKTCNPQQLSVTVTPNNATHKEVTWTSSDTNVATVSSTGLVTAISEGNVTITATSVDNPSISGSHNMTAEVSVTSVDIQEESVEIIAGDTTQLHVTVLPSNATDKTVTWSSSDTSIATVDNTGLVTGVGDGEVTITVTSKDNTSLTDTCTITSKIDYSRNYFTTVVTTGGNITWTGTENNVLSYSTDGGTNWIEASGNIPVSVGDKILWKGETTPGSSGIGKFSGDDNVRYSVEGNAMSLLFGNDFKGQTSLEGKNYAFRELFYNNTNVTSAENLSLPATILSDYCYQEMFSGCTSLITAPELPATTLTQMCYTGMFQECTSLTTAPELPATTLVTECYSCMFMECTSLTTAPKLPATTLAESCYNEMFNGCTSIVITPELPATTLANNCYTSMFNGCTSLTTAPELPATTLVGGCYSSMFQECTSLTTAPELPATTLAIYCYTGMFQSCTGLTTAPELPATTLVEGCYNQMFNGCKHLITAPELPATTLATTCYYCMFSDCIRLNSITCLATDISASNCTNSWVDRVASNGTFTKAAGMTGWTTGGNGIPTGWTVQDA